MLMSTPEPAQMAPFNPTGLVRSHFGDSLSGELEVMGTGIGMDRTDKNLRATSVQVALSNGAKDTRTPRTLK